MDGCGDTTIRFRPALIFEPKHLEIVLDTMDTVANDIVQNLKTSASK